jgi:hypothetical protein
MWELDEIRKEGKGGKQAGELTISFTSSCVMPETTRSASLNAF